MAEAEAQGELFRQPEGASPGAAAAPELPSGELELTGRVDRVFYSKGNFTTGRLRTDAGEVVTFAGPLSVEAEDRVKMRGRWVDHAKYGRQFQILTFQHDRDMSERGLATFLARHPDFRGVGPRGAERLVEAFGRDFGRVLEETPEKVAEVARVPIESARKMRLAWIETRELNETLVLLSSFGMTHRQVMRLVEALGNSAGTILRNDPYLVIERVPGFGFKRADEMALKFGTGRESPRRVEGAILHVVRERLEDGDTFVPGDALSGRARKLLSDGGAPVESSLVNETMRALIHSGKLVSVTYQDSSYEFGPDREAVGRADVFDKEAWIEDFLRDLGMRSNLGEGGEPDFGSLKAQQAEALKVARRASLVMTGGAGSGKTFTVARIADYHEAAGRVVRLAAPTGKAARRLTEVTGRPAETIHRLLEWKGSFQRNEHCPLDSDVVIVDEASMLDVDLAHSLFRAIDPERTQVVLVGDKNQLPPVGPGNLLRDLLKRGLMTSVKLDEIVRQAGVLREYSNALLEGKVHPTFSNVEGEDGAAVMPWIVARGKEFLDAAKVRGYIEKLYREVLTEKLGYDLRSDVQLLTPQKEGPLGTIELNLMLQRLVQRKLFGAEVPPLRGNRERALPMLHDRVIQLRNNYELDVMNGEVGVVVSINPLTVEFDMGKISYPKNSESELDLAYTLTVHKSQGSEFPASVFVAHSSHDFMLNRSLFYTAVTRARRTAVVLGDHAGIDGAARRVEVEKRRTFMSIRA